MNKCDYRKIDKELRPLVKAMNGTRNIITNSCCYGHSADDVLYVQFFCWQGFALTLSKLLYEADKQIEDEGIYCFIDCSFVYNFECHGCQYDAPLGYIAMSLHIETDSTTDKQKVVDILTDKFLSVMATVAKV